MKIGLIGCGNWGRNIAQTLWDLGCLYAIADEKEDRRGYAKSLWPEVEFVSNHEELLMKSLDAVALATPVETHYALCDQVLDAGKHAFVEKPMTMCSKQAERLVHKADQHGLVLMAGHIALYQPGMQWIQDHVFEIQPVMTHNDRLNLGTMRDHENVAWSVAIHDIAILVRMFRGLTTWTMPIEELNLSGTSVDITGNKVADDVRIDCIWPWGVSSRVHASWAWPHQLRQMILIGSQWILHYDEIAQEISVWRGGNLKEITIKKTEEKIMFQTLPPLQTELRHFIECIDTGASPISSGESAVTVIRLLEKIEERL